MSGLGETVGALARLRRRHAPTVSGDGRLREVPGFGANPGALRMLTYVPEALAQDAPLVVVLHGCTQTAQAYAEGAGWLELADRLGFAVVCPEQSRANNANRCFNWFEPGDTARGSGEVASIRAMIAHATAEYGIDTARVFVTGLSAGAAMAAALLASYPEVFAAGALIAGLAHGSASNVQEAVGAMCQGRTRLAPDWGDRVRAAAPAAPTWPRLASSHADDDSPGRPGAADDLVRQWTDVHGGDERSGVDSGSAAHAHRVWRDADGRAVVELHRIRGMNHGAPLSAGGEEGYGTPGPFLLEVGISSSLEIARFWGLAPRSTITAAPQADRRAAYPPLRAAGRIEPLVPVLSDAGQIISKALRSAGLLK